MVRERLALSLRPLMPLLLAGTCTAAASAPAQLTTSIPECRVPPAKVLPDKYYKLERSKKSFHWVPKANAGDRLVAGNGWEHIDGSDTYDWLSFYRVDLNGDGVCDWYLDASSPLPQG